MGRRIEQAADAQRRVDHEAAKRDAGALAFALQQIVGEGDRFAQIVERVADRAAQRIGQHRAVDLGRRPQEHLFHALVEGEGDPVHRLQRVVELFLKLLVGLKLLGIDVVRHHHRCAARQRHDHQEDQHKPPDQPARATPSHTASRHAVRSKTRTIEQPISRSNARDRDPWGQQPLAIGSTVARICPDEFGEPSANLFGDHREGRTP